MRKLVLVVVLMAICVAMVTDGKKDRERKERRRDGKKVRPQADAAQPNISQAEYLSHLKQANSPTPHPDTHQESGQSSPETDPQQPPSDPRSNSRCSDWVWQACEVRNGRSCGKGVERATRSGENCKKTEQVRPCRVDCKDAARGGGERDKEEKKKKKGNKGGDEDRPRGGAGGEKRNEPRPQPPKRQRDQTPTSEGENTEPCKYDKKDWTECDEQTSLQTRLHTLKSGDPAACRAEKVVTKPCDKYQRRLENKNDCEYVLGPWSVCNVTTDMRERHDRLTEPSKESDGCRLVRDIHQRCAVACVYSWGKWSDCDVEIEKRSIIGTLRREGITPSDCDETVTRTKHCYGKNGTEKCFFGPWSGYGNCVDGFKLRTRKLLVGGRRCELRASHAVPCKG